jgi:hypothetical protein
MFCGVFGMLERRSLFLGRSISQNDVNADLGAKRIGIAGGPESFQVFLSMRNFWSEISAKVKETSLEKI